MAGERPIRSRWAPRRGARAAGLVFVAALLAAACVPDRSEQVIAVAPGALADAADGVESGRFEMSIAGPDAMFNATSTGRFQGDDASEESTMSFTDGFAGIDGVDDAGVPEEVTTETRYVDGVLYARGLFDLITGGEPDPQRWTRLPVDLMGVGGEEGTEQYPVNPIEPFVEGLKRTVLDGSGVEAEVDGVAVTRHKTSVSGADAVELMEALSLSPGGYVDVEDGFIDDEDPFVARERLLNRYVEERTELVVVADIDQQGALTRAEMLLSTDLGEYPECEVFRFADTRVHLVLHDLGQEQSIEAPPSELVDDWSETSLDDMFGMDAMDDEFGDLEEFPTEEDFEALDESLPEDFQMNPVLQTAAGPRERYRVLDELIEWAEERNIAWQEVPPLESEQLVALYDMFFAQELETRGPALETSDGLHSRLDVVDAVMANSEILDINPATVAQMDDAALVEQFEVLIAQGVVPQPGYFGGFLPGDDEFLDEDFGSDSYAEAMESIYEGCPA